MSTSVPPQAAAASPPSAGPSPVFGMRSMTAADLPQIEKLDERAFGPGRFARTAYRLREGGLPDLQLSCVAHVGTLLIGSNIMTPVQCGAVRLLLLGPLSVDPAFQSRGIGEALMKRSLDAGRAAGYGLVILVGDEPYYARAGFKRLPQGKLSLPGPVDPARLLYCELAEGALAQVGGPIRKVR